MNEILLAVLLVTGLGALLGLGLAIASKVFAVPVNEKAEKIAEILPGANCGACGFSGCADYAAALAEGRTEKTNLCAPGGNDVAEEVAAALGKKAEKFLPTTAFVLCNGSKKNAERKMIYSGVKSCKMANQLFSGNKACEYGCLGFGDCAAVCEYDAIYMCDGIARINPLLCHSCKKCLNACPKDLIEMIPLGVEKAAVLCKNHEKGGVAKKQCKAACIGCMKCEKACEYDAVKVKGFVAYVDSDKCTGCGKCAEVCPIGCIQLIKPGVDSNENNK